MEHKHKWIFTRFKLNKTLETTDIPVVGRALAEFICYCGELRDVEVKKVSKDGRGRKDRE